MENRDQTGVMEISQVKSDGGDWIVHNVSVGTEGEVKSGFGEWRGGIGGWGQCEGTNISMMCVQYIDRHVYIIHILCVGFILYAGFVVEMKVMRKSHNLPFSVLG